MVLCLPKGLCLITWFVRLLDKEEYPKLHVQSLGTCAGEQSTVCFGLCPWLGLYRSKAVFSELIINQPDRQRLQFVNDFTVWLKQCSESPTRLLQRNLPAMRVHSKALMEASRVSSTHPGYIGPCKLTFFNFHVSIS